MHVFLIHGAEGDPEENWFPWLKAELEKHEHTVHAPHFPEPRSLERWRAAFKPYERFLSDDAVFVGHSIGCAFILDMLERHKAAKAVLASGFVSALGNAFDEGNRTFLKEFNWDAIRGNCSSFDIFHGSDDPYVPLERAEELGRHLLVTPHVIERGGHLNETAGFTVFPDVLRRTIAR